MGFRLPDRTLRRLSALVVAMGVSLAVGVFGERWLGLVFAGVSAALILRPGEPVMALATLAAVASFVDNEGGRLTRDLSVVTVIEVYTLVLFALARLRGHWRAPVGPLPLALLAFLAWTGVATVHGALVGNSFKFIGLEVAALGTMLFAWLAGGLRITSHDLRPALVVLVLTGLGHAALGLVSYTVNHVRTGGVWYTPLPGMLAVAALVFGARTRTIAGRLGWSLLLALFLLHQLISFSRGYWLGLLVGLPVTAILVARFGHGRWSRWRAVLGQGAMAVSILVLLGLTTAVYMGWTDLPELIGTRFGSSFSTENNGKSASNVERLMEYGAAFRRIQRNPILGYGMGLELRIREPFRGLLTRQWFIHQTYLWLWLKQGLVGLVLYLVVLVQAIRTGLAGARSPDRDAASWCLAATGATVYLAVVNMTTFHLAQVNSTMTLSMLWGFALATTNPPHWRLVWRVKPAPGLTPSEA